MSCLHAVVHGRVHGVGFRIFVLRCVARTPVTGWVRNLPNGAVEVLAEGPRSNLEALLARLRQGPDGAWVERLDADWIEPSGQYSSFEIRP